MFSTAFLLKWLWRSANVTNTRMCVIRAHTMNRFHLENTCRPSSIHSNECDVSSPISFFPLVLISFACIYAHSFFPSSSTIDCNECAMKQMMWNDLSLARCLIMLLFANKKNRIVTITVWWPEQSRFHLVRSSSSLPTISMCDKICFACSVIYSKIPVHSILVVIWSCSSQFVCAFFSTQKIVITKSM